MPLALRTNRSAFTFPCQLLYSASIISFVLPTSGWAQSPQTGAVSASHTFSIPAQPLEAALREYMRQSGVQIGYESGDIAGRTGAAVNGVFGPGEALSRLLSGTGLTYRFTAPTAVRLELAPAAAAGAVQLGPVRVEGQSSELGASGYAGGEQTATSPVSGYVARRSTTATKTDTPIMEVPQSISVVTRDSVDARASVSLAQALEYLPGITPTLYGEDSRYDWSIARGIGDAYGNTYRDGQRQGAWIFAVPSLEPYGAERIEFLRGPASILYGSNVPGGLINYVSRRPQAEAYGEIRARLGTQDRYGLAGDTTGPLTSDGTILYRLTGMWEHYDLQLPDSDTSRIYVAPAVTFQPGPDTDITILADYQRDRTHGNAYPAEARDERYGKAIVQDGFDHLYRNQYSLAYEVNHRFSDVLSVHSKGRYDRITIDYNSTGYNLTDDPSVIDRYSEIYRDHVDAFAFDNYLQAALGNDEIRVTTIVGLDYRRNKGDWQYGYADSTSFNVDTGETTGSFVEPVSESLVKGRNRQVGLYGQSQIKIAERFVVLLGGRQDWYKAIDTSGSVPVISQRQNAFTGRAGIVYLHPNGLAPYFSYSESFLPQQGQDYSGDDFKPTTGRQYEIGLRYQPPSTNLTLAVAAFDLRQQNVLVTDPDHLNFSIQQGEVASRGVELEANASLADGFNLIASYTFNDVKTTKDTDPAVIGRRPVAVSRHRATAWAQYSIPQGVLAGLGVGLGVRYNSKTWDYANTFTTPGVTLFDGSLSYSSDRWTASLTGRNLAGKDYVTNCREVDRCPLGDARSLIAALTYRW
ncbi:TonB-dependent siderophore receptor (plasmid) [Novosphingobium sp. BL-8A]|uniref:TonB-dependent siderophore receptor n=1 Tax=Novosphingobium sp. BL-8A TaxID=3127639 RepID=UPI00375648D0